MAKKTVIKVNIYCETCKSDALKAVTKLTGIDQVSIDRGKGILTVLGDVDPVCVVKKLRKIGKVAEIVTVEPSKPSDQPKPKPPTDQQKPGPPKSNPPVCPPLPCFCNECQYVVVAYDYSPCDNRFCSIL